MSSSFVPDTDPDLRSRLIACLGEDDPTHELLALAGWLEGRSDPRAELVRLQARCWQLQENPPHSFAVPDGPSREKDQREYAKLNKRLERESPRVLKDWLGLSGEDVIVTVDGSYPLLTVEIAATPQPLDLLRGVWRAGWVWWLDVNTPVGDEIVEEFLVNPGPVRALRFYANAGLRNGDLQWIGRIPLLRDLDLQETRITDEGLPHLYGLRTLRVVSLYETRVSESGIAALQQALPECYVFWRD